MEDILQKLKDYFANTPREEVLKGWEEAKRNAPKNSPLLKDLFKHEFRSISYEEVMSNRSSAYEFIDFDNPPYKEELNENSKGC